MLIGGIQVVGTFITTLIIEKFGRKLLLIVSDLFICISMLGVAIFFYLDEHKTMSEGNGGNMTSFALPAVFVSEATVSDIGFLPLASLMVFITAFSVGFGPVPWILNVELMPQEARVRSSLLWMF